MCAIRGEASSNTRTTSTSFRPMWNGKQPIIRRRTRSTSGVRRYPTISSSITKAWRGGLPPDRSNARRALFRPDPAGRDSPTWGKNSMNTVRFLSRIAALVITLAGALLVASAAWGAPSGAPVRIGSTLALTGPLASTALVHQLVGEIYVEQLNRRNGLLGRPVEWIVKDDQSKPELARTLYEQLITVDKVDLLMGPYATGAILSAMGVAQRYNKLLIHHTFGIPSLAKYDAQFPTWSLGPDPMVQAPEAKNALAATIFEEHPPFINNPGAAEFVQRFHERAAKAGLPYTGVETQAAASYSAWQVLEAAVNATKSLDDKVLAEWLRKNRVDTIQGKLRFDGPSNYGDDLMRVKQVQNGRWVVVWPKEYAAQGAVLQVQ